MSQVLVRELDPETVRLLKERAAANNRSLQAELRTILTAAARSSGALNAPGTESVPDEFLRGRLEGLPRVDSAEDIRANRDGVDYDRKSELEPTDYKRLLERAERKGWSVREEINSILEETIRRDRWSDPQERKAYAEKARKHREETMGHATTDSVELVRQFREDPRVT